MFYWPNLCKIVYILVTTNVQIQTFYWPNLFKIVYILVTAFNYFACLWIFTL